jgi:ribosome recycling factor
MLEGLEVEIGSKRQPLSRLAQVGVKDKATLSVLVFDPDVRACGS